MSEVSSVQEYSDAGAGEEEKKTKKRKWLESQVTAGCGYGKAKKRVLRAFWTQLWPRLESAGWTKVQGKDQQEGATYFVPPGVVVKRSRRGRQYYNSVKSVIERVLENRNDVEIEAAAAYTAEIDDLEDRAGKPIASTRPARRRFVPQRSLGQSSMRAHVDMGWKDNRMQFPKASSRVGPEYQVDELPMPNTITNTELESSELDGSPYYEQIWDPRKAARSGKMNFVHLTVPHNKKEAGMEALHKNNYSLYGFYEILNKVTPLDGSDWTQKDRDLFHLSMIEARKDLHKVSEKVGKSINNCLTYYLGKYKHSDDYRLTKEICVQERADKKSSKRGNAEACAVCKEGGNLLICDTCENGYHLNCVRPPLPNVPEGNWDCDDCLNVKLLEARSALLRGTGILKRESVEKSLKIEEVNSTKENSNPNDTDENGSTNKNPIYGKSVDEVMKEKEVHKGTPNSNNLAEDHHVENIPLQLHHRATEKFVEAFRRVFENGDTH